MIKKVIRPRRLDLQIKKTFAFYPKKQIIMFPFFLIFHVHILFSSFYFYCKNYFVLI